MFRHIGALRFRNKMVKSALCGTGCLISPNLVLTAAHNIFHSVTKELNTDLEFYPGQYGILEEENCYKVESAFFPDKFKYKDTATHDYGLLKL